MSFWGVLFGGHFGKKLGVDHDNLDAVVREVLKHDVDLLVTRLLNI